jgi:hypothetical protein
MNQCSKDIKDILESYGESSGLSLGFTDNLFINREPAKPVNSVTIFDTPGFPPDLSLDGATGYERPSVQIRVRNIKQDNAYALIERIKNVLHGLNQQVWNDTLYSLIQCTSGPALLDFDENGNARFVATFDVQRRNM